VSGGRCFAILRTRLDLLNFNRIGQFYVFGLLIRRDVPEFRPRSKRGNPPGMRISRDAVWAYLRVLW